MFPEIDRVKIFLSLTRPYSRICIRIYIFNFKKQTNKQKKKQKTKQNKNTKKEKETKEKKEYLQKID